LNRAPGERADRYELVERLGHGGMATVFLARTSGPAGFQKWVAVKRIHEHLSQQPELVTMFLDEARIAASLHHPNLAQVFELAESDAGYLLAMEYLHGEPLSAVIARASERGDRLAPELAAHVIARAAEGLHHAHEARTPDGAPMHVVHRDATPHNIFVTYDGHVKVTDFGVAKARGRITQSVSGSLKGKLAYASPEQLSGTRLDRRTDVFALGVGLWEACTGRRLYKGASEGETVNNVLLDRRPPLASVLADYPPRLEAIIDRALAADPDDRYPDAASLAEALDALVRESGHAVDSRALSARMHAWFEKERAEKEQWLRSPGEPSGAAIPRPGAEEPTVTDAVAEPAPRRRGWLLAAGGVVLALVAAALLALVNAAPDEPTIAPAARPAGASLRVRTTPPGATVSIDGARRDEVTPLVVDGLSPGTHHLRLTLAGHTPFEVDVDVREGRDMDVAYPLGPVRPSDAGAPDAGVTDAAAPASPAGRERARPRPARRAQGTLTLVTRPWSRVWINGRDRGTTTLSRVPVPAGTIRVRLQPGGRGPTQNLRIRVPPGGHASRNYDCTELPCVNRAGR